MNRITDLESSKQKWIKPNEDKNLEYTPEHVWTLTIGLQNDLSTPNFVPQILI